MSRRSREHKERSGSGTADLDRRAERISLMRERARRSLVCPRGSPPARRLPQDWGRGELILFKEKKQTGVVTTTTPIKKKGGQKDKISESLENKGLEGNWRGGQKGGQNKQVDKISIKSKKNKKKLKKYLK